MRNRFVASGDTCPGCCRYLLGSFEVFTHIVVFITTKTILLIVCLVSMVRRTALRCIVTSSNFSGRAPCIMQRKLLLAT